jgi:hypothetical protein
MLGGRVTVQPQPIDIAEEVAADDRLVRRLRRRVNPLLAATPEALRRVIEECVTRTGERPDARMPSSLR